MKNTTERSETLEAGIVRLVGTSRELIIKEVSRLFDDHNHYTTTLKKVTSLSS